MEEIVIEPTTIAVLRVQPGDVLAIECPTWLSADGMARMKQQLKHCFPDHQAMILTGGMRVVVARPEKEAHAKQTPVA